MARRIAKQYGWFAVLLGIWSVLPASADQSGLLQTDVDWLGPLETVQITVYDVNDFCQITVTNPIGVAQTFAGQVQDGQATASYVPSYLPGTYQIYAETTGSIPLTETDTFAVLTPSDAISIANWQCDATHYVPGQNLTFTFDLSDSTLLPLSGFSSQLSDSRGDSNDGRLSILRKIMGIAEDGTATARLFIYFDTIGQWSDIRAGTEVRISLYNPDGSAPLNNQIIRTTGFENNDGVHLSSTLTETLWTVYVDANFGGSDKIAYLDFEVPPELSISDILIAVEYIKYNYNTTFEDEIYIAEQYLRPTGYGVVFTTGSEVGALGRMPAYLPMTPNENGLLFYGVHAADSLGQTHINNGTVTESDGDYTNIWKWDDYIDTTANFYIYADKWGYAHDYAGPITLSAENAQGSGSLAITGFSANPDCYFPGEPIDFSFTLTDDLEEPAAGFTGTIADPLPNTNNGGFFILRNLLDAQPDGSSTARLYLYFDTTGQWSNIYTPTTVKISLYNRDGITPLTDNIDLSTGFENNEDNTLSSTLVSNQWTIAVASNFSGADKIAYLDFSIPPSYSVSDIVFSVDSIFYNNNRTYHDEIYITTARTVQNNFPVNPNGDYEFMEGSSFTGLGTLPIKLTLNPNPNGFVYYGFGSADIPETHINFGDLSSAGNQYLNHFTWNDVIDTTAQVFVYADGVQYSNHAVSSPIGIGPEPDSRTLDLFDYALDHWGYTLGQTRQFSASVDDGAGNPQNNLTLRESISDSNSGKLSIVSRHTGTDPNGCSVVRLLMLFDTTGQWSDIHAGTRVDLSVFGPDGTSGVPASIEVIQGDSNADGYLASTLTETGGVYSWTVEVTTGFTGADRQVWLDFVMPEPYSASQVVYSVNSIKYSCRRDWADSITIKNVTVNMNSFPVDYFGQYEFKTGSLFGSLGRLPLYLSLNPGAGSVYPKMISTEEVPLTGSMSVSSGRYTYSHTFDEAGKDYETKLCVSRYGYLDNECLCTDSMMLYFTGEPRYLGGLDDAVVMLGETWEKNLHEHFYVELDLNNVQYISSDPNLVIVDHTAVFAPTAWEHRVTGAVITAQSKTDPNLIAFSDPFTLIAAECTASYDCSDPQGRPVSCNDYRCEAYDRQNSYHSNTQGVDLSVFNQDVTISNAFPDPNETVLLCATIKNTGTTNVFDVVTRFYLDDVNSVPIDSNSVIVLPTTYMDLPLRTHEACIQWTVPADLHGGHRIWVEVSGRYPLEMEEDMLSNNYATVDFFVHDPEMQQTDPAAVGDCPELLLKSMPKTMPMTLFDASPQCQTMTMRIPIQVRVCENETLCGPVMGIELGYWNTLYWPSWSGYCQEFGVPQEMITDFIRTYEKIYGLGSQGAASSLPSWTDFPGLFEPPDGWGDGWLPCHPEPTMFWPNSLYVPGVMDPGCGGVCPISAWDCGQGVSFQPRFSSPLYNAYEFRTYGGARQITRCHTEGDSIEVPYQICYTPGDDTPFHIPFTPFQGGPGGSTGGSGGGGGGSGCCYGPNGPAGSGPGGGPPIEFTIAGDPTDAFGNPLPFAVTFCSTGTSVSNEQEDILLLTPNGGGPDVGILLQQGWNQFAPLLEPLEETADRRISLKAGWNFFGYSSMTPLLWTDAVIENGIEEKSIEQAHTAGWIQGVLYTLDHETLLYQLVPGDDDFLRNKRAYWLYAAQANLTLKLPSAGGSPVGTSAPWEQMRIVNGQEIRTMEDAAAAGWIDPAAYYVDPNGPGYKPLPAEVNEIEVWQGYWLWSHLNGLRLLADQEETAILLQKEKTTAIPSKTSVTPVKTEPEEGLPAPDFLLKRMDGQPVCLRDFRGSDVLLVFGNTRCPYCSGKIPLLNRLHKSGEFEVIFVALGATPKTAARFAGEQDIAFPVLVDSNQLVGRRYGIRAVPEVFVIDADGIIRQQSTTEGPLLWYLLEGKKIPPSLQALHPEVTSYD